MKNLEDLRMELFNLRNSISTSIVELLNSNNCTKIDFNEYFECSEMPIIVEGANCDELVYCHKVSIIDNENFECFCYDLYDKHHTFNNKQIECDLLFGLYEFIITNKEKLFQ